MGVCVCVGVGVCVCVSEFNFDICQYVSHTGNTHVPCTAGTASHVFKARLVYVIDVDFTNLFRHLVDEVYTLLTTNIHKATNNNNSSLYPQ